MANGRYSEWPNRCAFLDPKREAVSTLKGGSISLVILSILLDALLECYRLEIPWHPLV